MKASEVQRAVSLLVRNTNRLYDDRILHAQFAVRNRRIWRAIEARGQGFVRACMKALRPALEVVR